MTEVPDNPDARFTRERTAEALTSLGYKVAPKTLATKATRGGGRPYSLFGGCALYRWGDALEWAQSMTPPSRCSISEADAKRSGT